MSRNSFLDFSQEAKAAAQATIKSWGYDLTIPIEEIIGPLECDIDNNSGWRGVYGVEQAILSGQRIRLLHEIPKDSPMMNCSEVGINMYLLYDAIGAGEKVRLALADVKGYSSTHFSLFSYIDWPCELPTIIDPLLGLFGKVKFCNGGFIYYPLNWYTSMKSGLSLMENLRMNCDSKPSKIEANLEFMTKDEIIRHVNFINSEAGFFHYYMDGQKINISNSVIGTLEASVQTKDNDLIIRLTCQNMFFLPVYTFERTYSSTNGVVGCSERELLHTGLQWTTPKGVLYERSKEHELIRYEKSGFGTDISEAIEYIRCLSDGKLKKLFMEPSQLVSFLCQDMVRAKKVIEKDMYYLQLINECTEYVNELAETQPSEVRVELNKNREIINKINSNLAAATKMSDYVEFLPFEQQAELAERIYFHKEFKVRSYRPVKPYFKFNHSDGVLSALSKHADHMRALNKENIDALFSSKTVQNLVEDFNNCRNLQQSVERAHISTA